MEDLWRIQNSEIDVKGFADYAEYKLFIKRFCEEEEQANRQQLLYGNTSTKKPRSK